jgi:hypothetical protein
MIFGWILCPSEWLGIDVVFEQESVDGRLECDGRMEHTAFKLASGQLGEEAFDGIQP